MTNTELKRCLLCNTPTSGSVGAAGLKWMSICQPCKDEEDNAALNQLKGQAKVFDALISGSTK